ncbi:polycomb protein suz12-like [Antedon mediterranea]|uniref:polycomb protein suz12-like n=1 Tax=Antedon mediterranea TaxID=105859 RepID=UPI003AF78C83
MAPHKQSSVRCSPKKLKNEEIEADHELFLQAFKKPTQIYRFLRTRNLIAPVFLHRSLTYLKKRNSRDNKRRKVKHVDDILKTVEEKHSENHKDKFLGDFLELKFGGFFPNDVPILSQESCATLEISLIKICHKRRKDTSPYEPIQVGRCRVPIDPADLSTELHSTISINSQLLDSTNGHTPNSYVLHFKVHFQILTTEKLCNYVSEECSLDETPNKRRRPSRSQDTMENITYTSELAVLDKYGRCQLTPAKYELVFQETKVKGTKNASWETIMEGKNVQPFELINKGPVLKFHTVWHREQNGVLNGSTNIPNGLNHYSSVEDDEEDITAIKNKEAVVEKLGKDLKMVSEKRKHRVFYQFLYNNNTKQQTEARENMHCPWCSLNCMQLYGLLKHLTLCHSRFNFTYIPCESNTRIDVTLNEHFDGSYAGNPQNLTSHAGYAFSRNGPCRRTPVTQILVMKRQRKAPTLNEFLEGEDRDLVSHRPFVSGHNRVYHHTHTLQPLTPQEMDIDSEDEIDPSWLKERTSMMIDEFTDVNEGEKELMKLWNVHVLKNNFMSDSLIPRACRMFVQDHGPELVKLNLKSNFLLHMVNLFDFSLIQPPLISSIMADLDKFEESAAKEPSIPAEHMTYDTPGCSQLKIVND